MKISFLSMLITVFLLSELSGQHLDVEGRAKIIDNIAVHHPMDSTDVFIGTKYGNGMSFDISYHYNTFMGSNAGTIIGNQNNSFFQAGMDGTGIESYFFCTLIGQKSTENCNAFFGAFSSVENTTVNEKCFIGFESGNSNTMGSQNSFFGKDSVVANGNDNSFFGNNAGHDNQKGDENCFFEIKAGYMNITGNSSTYINI